MNTQKKKNSDETNPFANIYWASVCITSILGFVTPLVSFNAGVFGFGVLVLFILYTFFKLQASSEEKIFALIIVLVASHRLLFYAVAFANLYFYYNGI